MINHRGYQVACRTKALTLSVAATTPFARASTATYTDVNGIVQTAPINVLRNAHYVNGVLQPPLLELAATNSVLWSSDFSNVAWSKANITVTTGIDDPAGGLTACTLTATGANGNVQQNLSAGVSIVRTSSFWMRRRTGSGTVSIQKPDGSANVVVLPTGGWTPFSALGIAGTARRSIVSIGTSGDAIDVWGAQIDDAATASSTILTTTVPVTRAADIDQMFAATATGYSRQIGSFLTEGFAPGMEITPLGYASNPVDTLTDVSALTLTTKSPRTVESALAGRGFSVGLPLARAWENKKPPADPPVQGVPFVKEQYIPGPPAQQVTVGPFGDVELMPMYALHIHVPNNCGFEAASAYADAIMRLFTPRTAMAVGSEFLRVHARGPFRGQLLNSAPGFAVVPITAPLYIRTPNSI